MHSHAYKQNIVFEWQQQFQDVKILLHSTTRLLWHKPRGCRTYYLRLPPYLQCSFYTTKRKRQLIFNPWVACKNEYLFVLYYMYLVDLLLVFFLLLSFLCLFSGIHFHLPHFRNSCSQIRHPDKLEDKNTSWIIWTDSINSKTCKKLSLHKNYSIGVVETELIRPNSRGTIFRGLIFKIYRNVIPRIVIFPEYL